MEVTQSCSILTQQMRQAEDPRYAEAMARLRIHEPTDEDIAMLNSRIGAPIPDSPSASIIVHRHYVRHALNLQKLKYTAANNGTSIIYCKAEVASNQSCQYINCTPLSRVQKKHLE